MAEHKQETAPVEKPQDAEAKPPEKAPEKAPEKPKAEDGRRRFLRFIRPDKVWVVLLSADPEEKEPIHLNDEIRKLPINVPVRVSKANAGRVEMIAKRRPSRYRFIELPDGWRAWKA